MGLEQRGLQPAQRLATLARIFRTLTCGGGCAADCSPSSARSGTLHLGEGMFSGSGSAGSGDVYLNDQECWWLIEAAHLAVTGFHTEDGYDYVSVREGREREPDQASERAESSESTNFRVLRSLSTVSTSSRS